MKILTFDWSVTIFQETCFSHVDEARFFFDWPSPIEMHPLVWFSRILANLGHPSYWQRASSAQNAVRVTEFEATSKENRRALIVHPRRRKNNSKTKNNKCNSFLCSAQPLAVTGGTWSFDPFIFPSKKEVLNLHSSPKLIHKTTTRAKGFCIPLSACCCWSHNLPVGANGTRANTNALVTEFRFCRIHARRQETP